MIKFKKKTIKNVLTYITWTGSGPHEFFNIKICKGGTDIDDLFKKLVLFFFCKIIIFINIMNKYNI